MLQQGVLGMSAIATTRKMMEINVTALINLTQYAVRLATGDSSLSIINLASIAGTQGMEGIAAYSASKGAVVSFTLAAAKELARRGIRINAIAPGFIDTPMTQQLPPRMAPEAFEQCSPGPHWDAPGRGKLCSIFSV
jgi:3-oxoacyl-[acyl-carrier protein] reductase